MRTVLLALLLFSTHPFSARADAAGVDSSGGGNSYIAAFRASAEALLNKIDFSSEHRKALELALTSSRIVSVKVLKDSAGQPVAEQSNMLAYSSPYFIQLKEQGDGGDSWEAAVKTQRPLAHIVIHELFRASGLLENGRSVDDTFHLSVGKYKLNQVDSMGFKLSEPVELHYWKCQCFEDQTSGAPDGGMNLIGPSTLFDAEKKALSMCQENFFPTLTLARCHKFVGDPNSR